MWTVLAIFAVSFAAPATGAPDRAVLQNIFRTIDRDGNGYVTDSEQPRVARITVNGSNSASIRPGRSWISKYDANDDGRVSSGEFVSRAEAEIASYPHGNRRGN